MQPGLPVFPSIPASFAGMISRGKPQVPSVAGRHALPDTVQLRFGAKPSDDDGVEDPFEGEDDQKNREAFELALQAFWDAEPVGNASLMEQVELLLEQLGPMAPERQLSLDLEMAIREGHLEKVGNALMAGADPNEHVGVLMNAASACPLWQSPKPSSVLQLVMAHPAFKPELALPYAVREFNPGALKVLLQDPKLDKASPEFRNLLNSFSVDSFSRLKDRKTGQPFARQREVLELLLSEPGIDLNARSHNGATFLHAIANMGNEDLLHRFLQQPGLQTGLTNVPKNLPGKPVRTPKTAVDFLRHKIRQQQDGLPKMRAENQAKAQATIAKYERMIDKIEAYASSV